VRIARGSSFLPLSLESVEWKYAWVCAANWFFLAAAQLVAWLAAASVAAWRHRPSRSFRLAAMGIHVDSGGLDLRRMQVADVATDSDRRWRRCTGCSIHRQDDVPATVPRKPSARVYSPLLCFACRASCMYFCWFAGSPRLAYVMAQVSYP